MLDPKKVERDFCAAVNMSEAEMKSWLDTAESRAAGWKGRENERSETVGHASGRRIVQILTKSPSELTDDDYAHMQKVVGFIRRHIAQEPENKVSSRWRYSLMNWGHDPLKD